MLCKAFAILLALIALKVECHIGEPCNSLLKMCLPLSTHMYCDDNNICQCKKEYPVQVGAHSCRAAKRVHERCSHPEECAYSDPNAYCTQTPYSSQCECHEGFAYDNNARLCVSQKLVEKDGKPSNAVLIIPTTAGFLMACFSLLCCCVLIWHNVCRKHEFMARNGAQIPAERARRSRSQPTNGESVLNRRIASNTVNEIQVNTLPPYESVLILHNEPPPSYEDAIKYVQTPSSSDSVETKT